MMMSIPIMKGYLMMLLIPMVMNQASLSVADTLQDLQDRITCLETSVDRLVNTLGSNAKPRVELVRKDRIETPPEYVVGDFEGWWIYFADCHVISHYGGEVDGVYFIWPDGEGHAIKVLCRFDTDGEWIVLQQRMNGDIDFAKPWASYRMGFGDVRHNSEYWLGLENMYQITRQQQYTLRIDLMDWTNRQVYAEYSIFSISDEEAKYAIFYDGYSGTAGDYMGDHHRHMKFSTSDRDNDNYDGDCASYHGPWWLNACDSADLNGRYGQGLGNRGIEWGDESVDWKQTTMRIRPTLTF